MIKKDFLDQFIANSSGKYRVLLCLQLPQAQPP